MLELRSLSVDVETQQGDKRVLEEISCNFELGKNYCLLGKNGSGKSSLALTLMGHPKFHIAVGDILIDGNSIITLSPDERAKMGVFLAFQSIPEIKGIKLFEFLRSIYSAKIGKQATFISFKKIIEPLMAELRLDKEFLRRDLNVGFSGGERRKVEILQIKLLEPRYILLDEIDSGLDVDAFKTVALLMQELNSNDNTFIIITHYFSILDYIPVDWVYVLENGKLITQGNKSIADTIRDKGFE